MKTYKIVIRDSGKWKTYDVSYADDTYEIQCTFKPKDVEESLIGKKFRYKTDVIKGKDYFTVDMKGKGDKEEIDFPESEVEATVMYKKLSNGNVMADIVFSIRAAKGSYSSEDGKTKGDFESEADYVALGELAKRLLEMNQLKFNEAIQVD